MVIDWLTDKNILFDKGILDCRSKVHLPIEKNWQK